MFISNNKSDKYDTPINMNQTELEVVKSHKHLGVLYKSYFVPQNDGMEKRKYVPLYQSIIIHNLTCKLCLVLWKKFMTRFWVIFQ